MAPPMGYPYWPVAIAAPPFDIAKSLCCEDRSVTCLLDYRNDLVRSDGGWLVVYDEEVQHYVGANPFDTPNLFERTSDGKNA